MNIGDICLFGSMPSGWNKYALVAEKKFINTDDDKWIFRSPSGTPLNYGFRLETPKDTNITSEQLREIIETSHYQTQTLLPENKAEKVIKLLFRENR